jgi:SNF2 family DNA or RNA helicase
MTAPVTEQAPSSEWPEGAVFHSPKGLYPFQTNDIARALVMRSEGTPHGMFQWDTGLGKSIAALALAAFTLEDEAADVVLLVCEKIKLKEWLADFEQFTRLSARIHHGPSRKGKVTKLGMPKVIISTYETLKADLVSFEPNAGGRGKHATHGWLMDELVASGLKPMVIMDEADKLSNRTSANYKSWDHVLRTFRKLWSLTPVYMLTATSVRKDLENSFNQLRLLAPKSMPKINEFEKYFMRGRDMFGRPRYHEYRIPEFVTMAQPLLFTKSKEDPDVRDQFPVMTEEAMWTDLEGPQRELYDCVYDLDADGDLMALRQICAHPASLIYSAEHGTSDLTKTLVQELGEDYLRALPSAKTDRLVEYLRPLVNGQGAKAVVFSFFGPSVLPLLKAALEAKGIQCWSHNEDGGIEAFKSSRLPGVLLASDAAARGINLPEASYLVEYDIATTYGARTQRINRISRIGQGGPTATVRTMLARKSVEIGLMYAMLRGNGHSDYLLGKEDGADCMTAAMRRRLLTNGMDA